MLLDTTQKGNRYSCPQTMMITTTASWSTNPPSPLLTTRHIGILLSSMATWTSKYAHENEVRTSQFLMHSTANRSKAKHSPKSRWRTDPLAAWLIPLQVAHHQCSASTVLTAPSRSRAFSEWFSTLARSVPCSAATLPSNSRPLTDGSP